MARKLKCECNDFKNCHTCYMRDYARRAAAKKKLTQGEGHAERTARIKKKNRIDEIISEKREITPTQAQKMPLLLRINDFTRIGLDISIHWDGRTICVGISLPERDMSTHMTAIQRIRQRDHKTSEVEVI